MQCMQVYYSNNLPLVALLMPVYVCLSYIPLFAFRSHQSLSRWSCISYPLEEIDISKFLHLINITFCFDHLLVIE